MKKFSKLINFPLDLVKEIEQYQKDNYINGFTGAVIELIRKGLTK